MSFPNCPTLITNDDYRKRRKRLVKDSAPLPDSMARYCPDCGGTIYYLRHPEYVSYLRRVGDEEPAHFWCYYCLRFFQRENQLLTYLQLVERRLNRGS